MLAASCIPGDAVGWILIGIGVAGSVACMVLAFEWFRRR